MQSIRHPEILEIARRDGKVTVEGLSRHFDVTLQTIRRDLAELAEAGRLDRVHGGAILPSGTANIAYDQRRDLMREEKARIAEACARAIPQGASVVLNIGSTTEAVARALVRHRNLLVVTNNINVARIVAEAPECRVILTAGTLRAEDGGLVGPLAAETIAKFRFDIAVIGCSALDAGSGEMLDFDLQEVEVSKVILEQARQKFLVADSSKFTRKAPARIGSMAQIDRLYTDAPAPASVAALCAGWGTRIVTPD